MQTSHYKKYKYSDYSDFIFKIFFFKMSFLNNNSSTKTSTNRAYLTKKIKN